MDNTPSHVDTQKEIKAAPTKKGKDEMNLAEFPIARLGRNDTRGKIEYVGQIVKNGETIHQKWIAEGSLTFGLPTEFAERVLIALIAITAHKKFADRKVSFTIYRVLAMLGLTRNQRNYLAVEKALQQLVGVTIYSEDAFWDKRQEKRVTIKKGFHILEEFWLKSQEGDLDVIEVEKVNGYVLWSERIWDSFKSGYIKNLDTEFYYSLESTLARRLYRFLDKRMHHQDAYQIDVYDLAARLGMKPYPFPSKQYEKMVPAIDELIERGFLASAGTLKYGKFTRVKFVKVGARAVEQLSFLDDGEETMGTEQETHARQMLTQGGIAVGRESSASPEQAHIWSQLLNELKLQMPSAPYNTWVRDTWVMGVEGDNWEIGLPNSFSKDWIENRLRHKIKRAMESMLHSHITLRFTVGSKPFD